MTTETVFAAGLAALTVWALNDVRKQSREIEQEKRAGMFEGVPIQKAFRAYYAKRRD